MTERGRILAWIAGGSAIAFAVTIALAVRWAGNAGLEAPDPLERGVVSTILLAVPGVIGWIGIATGRRVVLVAAGLVCLIQSALSFSLVTLVYLLPAIAFLRSAIDRPDGGPRQPVRVARLIVGGLLAVPIAVAIALWTGILGILLLSLVAGLGGSRGRGDPPRRVSGREAARGATIVGLVLGAWMATFVLAETACWLGRGEPGGAISWERVPPADTFNLGDGVVAATCAGGTLTPAGVGVAGGLVGAALLVAVLPVPRRVPRDESA